MDLEIGDGIVTTTEDHPFWNASDQAWQPAAELGVGEAVQTADGDRVAVEGIDWATQTGGMAYNLTVADLHTYFVVVGEEELLVHNECNPDPKPRKCGLDQRQVDSFLNGQYQTETLTSSKTLYRVFGGGAQALGPYWSDVPPTSSDAARSELALPPGNNATDVVTIQVPAGTTIHTGIVAPDNGYAGGGRQIIVEGRVDDGWITSCKPLGG